MSELTADLRAESDDLLRLLAPLAGAEWESPTPAEGWAVRDQVSHLAWFDDAAVRAATAPEAFRAEVAELLAEGADTDRIVVERRSMAVAELLGWFETSRARMLDVFGDLDPKLRVPWYGPEMSAASFATARLMETWAHGQDIADGLGVSRVASDRLRHVAQIGARAVGWSYTVHGRPVPAEPIRMELSLPSGATWTSGPLSAADLVRGSALDFCLVVTQRRHRADTGLVAVGPVAAEWLDIAQAFAGPAGPGRSAGQFS
jgi:uncharacterized protein (TIGR03084 family)